MATVVLSINREILPKHTDEQFRDWVEFEVGSVGGMRMDNPLFREDMEATVIEIS